MPVISNFAGRYAASVKKDRLATMLAIGTASAFYSGILDDIEKHDYDVFIHRTSLSSWGKISRIPSLWLKVRSL
jgi:phytoene/squalene synthetase